MPMMNERQRRRHQQQQQQQHQQHQQQQQQQQQQEQGEMGRRQQVEVDDDDDEPYRRRPQHQQLLGAGSSPRHHRPQLQPRPQPRKQRSHSHWPDRNPRPLLLQQQQRHRDDLVTPPRRHQSEGDRINFDCYDGYGNDYGDGYGGGGAVMTRTSSSTPAPSVVEVPPPSVGSSRRSSSPLLGDEDHPLRDDHDDRATTTAGHGRRRRRRTRHSSEILDEAERQGGGGDSDADADAESHVDDAESISVRSPSEQQHRGGSGSEWTLQTFEDHQLNASYLNGVADAKGSKGGSHHHHRRWRRQQQRARRRQLSLINGGPSPGGSPGSSSSPSSSPGSSDDGLVDEANYGGQSDPGHGHGPAVIPREHVVVFVPRGKKKRLGGGGGGGLTMLPPVRLLLLASACLFAAVALCGTFLLSSSDPSSANITSLKDFFRGGDDNNRGGGEGGVEENAGGRHGPREDGEDWHPLFQHGERTADMEVEVPLTPSAKPIMKDHPGGMISSSGLKGGSGSSSFSGRRVQDSQQATAGGGGNEGGGANGDNGGGGGGGGGATFVMGESEYAQELDGGVIQDLCPATHSLISQSEILRSSYGNIFSITTPDAPTAVQKRNNNGGNGGGGGGKKVFTRDKDTMSEAGAGRRGNDVGGGNGGGGRIFSRGNNKPVAGGEGGEEDDSDNGDGSVFTRRTLQSEDDADSSNYNDIDTATDSIYAGTGVETITITTLSLRMADYKPDEETHFEVWLYTGSGDDVVPNANDLDDDPTNDNTVVPSKGEYQTSRAKFTDWILIAEGMESDLIQDTDFFDHNGHVFNIGPETTVGPLGRLDKYENMEDVTLDTREWNDGKLRRDGGMDAATADGEITQTYFFKIPPEKFMPLKLPKYDGKLTLFVTLDRVGLQYGYAAKREFDGVDVMKHDYIDQTPSLDVLNGNVNLRMHVGEGVIFYPWMEEEFFYQTRRFLGKVWYDALIPCEYAPIVEVLEVETTVPSSAPTVTATYPPSTEPSLAPSENGTIVTADLLVSVLIKDGPLPPMPPDTKKVFEETLLDFVDDTFGDFCPITWNKGADVTGQQLSDIGGLPTGASSTGRKRNGNGDGDGDNRGGGGGDSKRQPPADGDGRIRHLRKLLLEPIFRPAESKARSRLLAAITLLDASTTIDGLYSSNICPDKSPEELATLLEEFINDNKEELLDRLKAADDYFADAFGVSADAILPTEIKAAEMAAEEEDDNLGLLIGGIIAAFVLCCFCCCLPLLVIRRRRRKESKENEIIGEDVEWARPVSEDHFPPLGGYREDLEDIRTVADESTEEITLRRKRPDGELPAGDESPPPIGLNAIPPGIRPPEEDSEMVHSHRFLDVDVPEKDKKTRPFGMPGRMPGEGEGEAPYNINMYPGGDYEDEVDPGDDHNLRRVENDKTVPEVGDWKPDHYEPSGGVHGYLRPQKPSVPIRGAWNRLPERESPQAQAQKKLSIKQLVLQRKKDLEAKKTAMRHVEQIEKGEVVEEDQVFPKAEPDDRIEDLMTRIKDLESDRTKKYQRNAEITEESDYERWRRLNIEEAELSSSEESSDEEIMLQAVKKKKKKKKQAADDYMLKFDDLDAYNKALAVHQDAYIHKWVKVKVEKEDGEEDEGAALDDIEIPSTGKGEGAVEEEEFVGDLGDGEEEGVGEDAAVEDSDGGEGAEGGAQGRPDLKTEYLGDLGDADDTPPEEEDIPSDDADMPYAPSTDFALEDNGGEEDADTLKNEIILLVGQVLPDQLEFVDDLLAQFEGREAALRDMLRAKAEEAGSDDDQGINVVDDDEPPAAPAADIKNEIVLLVGQVLPDQLEFVDDLLAQFEGREEALRDMLRAKAEEAGTGDDDGQGRDAVENDDPPAAVAAAATMGRRARFADQDTPTNDRRSLLSREKTEYIGSVRRGIDDEDSPPPAERRARFANDDAPMSDRRSLLSRGKTEYIGSVRGGMDDEDSPPQAGWRARFADDTPGSDRRSLLSREKTEYIGSVRGMDGQDSPPSSDRRSLLSREKTEYIGSIRGMGEEDDSPRAGRRSLLSREKTEYIGSVRGMGDEEATPMERRSLLSRGKTEYIGSIRDMDEDEDIPTDRRSSLSREKTEYIGSIRGMDEDESTPMDRRSSLSREKTEYIGSIRGMGEEDDTPTERRSTLSREKTEWIGDLGNIEEDEDESE